jgi:tRNA threonylcarbamoyladenosine biosynthesis protein TsaB
MLILALDTSGKSLSTALVRDDEIVGESLLNIGLRHSATALPLVRDLCDRCGVRYSDIDAFACATGPGSYTGIRIGISLVKGLAYAEGKPAVGVSTLDALARAVARPDDDAVVVPMIDARSGRFFCSAVHQDRTILPEGNRMQRELAAELADLIADRPASGRRLLLTGDGATAFLATEAWPGATSVADAGPAFRWPKSSVIALLAQKRLQAGGDCSPFALEATYVSPSQAERLRHAHE